MPPRRVFPRTIEAVDLSIVNQGPSRVSKWAANLALALASAVFTLVALEHTVFRFILVPDDVLANVSTNGVVRYAPNTRAFFRHPDGRETLVTTNSDGWNSTKPAYSRERVAGRLRVAVLGDSYVHGTFVNVDQGFPELIERDLVRSGVNAEVYRFGMDGAPLSQYLHMLRREVVSYRPDIVVVPLIHNDFDESYRLLKTRYASSFLKIKQDAAGRFEEVPPAEFKPGTADILRNSRLFRYMYYKTGLYLSMKNWTSRFFWGGDEEWAPEFTSSAVDIRKINDHAQNKLFARYIMREMQALSDREGFRLAFVMDGVREAVYEGRSPMDYEVGRLNKIAGELTAELDLPLLDLQHTFARDFAQHQKRFEFSYDWHWNEHGNAVVATAITEMLLSDSRLVGGLPRLTVPGPSSSSSASSTRQSTPGRSSTSTTR